MYLKKTSFVLSFLLMLSIYIFSADENTVNYDNVDERNAYLNSDNWILKFSTSANDNDNFKLWKGAKLIQGEGFINTNKEIIEFGNSKYGGYIWKSLDFNFVQGKEYLIIVKTKSNTKNSYIWFESKNNEKIIKENNTIFNAYDIKKIHYKSNDTISELNFCIGYLNYPDLIKVYNGRGYIVTWQPWMTSVAWVEIWEK